MSRDRLGIVQFLHPGKERGLEGASWNAAKITARGHEGGSHGRKFIASQADYIDATGKRRSGSVGFWGEWEPPSSVRRLTPSGPDHPEFVHVPALYKPSSWEGLLDTDPFVFGSRMLYTGCQQHTGHCRPGGASETFLRRLSAGSMILFGSGFGHKKFVLDTVFVVAGYVDYPRGRYDGLACLDLPEEYYIATLKPSAEGNPTVDSYRLYLGATLQEPVDGMYSFTPCLPAGRRIGFARPAIRLPCCVNPAMTQGKKFTETDAPEIKRAWQDVRLQVLSRGLMLGHRIALNPIQLVARGCKTPPRKRTPQVSRKGRPTVEVVSKGGITFKAFRSPGKDKAYTQAMTECKVVELRQSDRIADVGAFIGEYSMFCATRGVSRIIAYEPTPSTFDVLKQNIERWPFAAAVHAAVVADSRSEVELYLSTGNGTRNRIRPSKTGEKVVVPAISYREAIQDATVVKLDVEGAEWSYPIAENLAPPLRAILIEFHPHEDGHEAAARELVERIERAGFRAVMPVDWVRFVKHGKRWSAHGAWVHPDR